MQGFGSEIQNNPLYLQSFMEGDDALKFHYIVHCSLDVIEEKGVQHLNFLVCYQSLCIHGRT